MISKINRDLPFYIFAIVLSVALTACNDIVDYGDGYCAPDRVANDGAPVITAVYDVKDTQYELPITEGNINQMVTIVGRNLNEVTSVKFNTVECDMANVYTASTKAVVQIPSRLSLEQANRIEYTTRQGTAYFDFSIPFPDLTVDGPDCEFKSAGQKMLIYGQNFDIYGFDQGAAKVTLNGETLTPDSIAADLLRVLIPEGTADNSVITLSWNGKDGLTQTATMDYRPTRHLLYGDMDGVSINADGAVKANLSIEDDGQLWGTTSSLGHRHLHIAGSYDAWSWNTIDLSCNMVEADGDLTTLDDYVLKFEVLSAKNFPLTPETGIKFNFNWSSDWQWNIGDGAGIDSKGDWVTVALPLDGMATKGISQPGSWQTLRIIFQPSVAMDVDFRMGNFRIERKRHTLGH